MIPTLSSTAIDGRTHTPWKIAAAVSTLAEYGVPASRVLQGTGLTEDALRDAATRSSLRQLLLVCSNALELAPDPALAFRIGARLRVSSYGMYGYALMCAPTLRHAYDVAMRYHLLAAPVVPIAWEDSGPTTAWVLPGAFTYEDHDVSPALARFLLEMQAAIHVTLHQDVMGADCLPCRAQVIGAPPPHAGAYEASLRCPVEFGQPRNELHYDAAWLGRTPQLANPITAAALVQSCATLLAEAERATGVAGQVYKALMSNPGRFPDIETIAARMHTTARTLRRKLDSEGTSYQRLLADVRRSLAIDYLRGTSLSNEDIAEALGFSDGASFRHAFKRWTSRSPSDYRQSASSGH
jgi:AraC-like DNA-binding protein